MELSGQKAPLKTSDSVREIENQDGAVLLDIRQGVCLSMTPAGIRIWRMLKLNCSVSEIVCRLAADFNEVPERQIADDVAGFIVDLERKGLLAAAKPVMRTGLLERLLVAWQSQVASSATPGKRKVPRFLLWKALVGLLVFDLFRFGNDFSRIHRLIQQWPVMPFIVPDHLVDRVCHAVNYACVWYPKRVMCLQRSVITTCLLRICGVEAQMVMGAQKLPFKAHAWTEVDGKAINERRNVQLAYMVWERC
jgi:hypothetical protein